MRSQSKPFAIEIKKRRGRASERPSLFGKALAVAEAATIAACNRAELPDTADVVFKQQPKDARGEGASPAGGELPRILPDLTAEPAIVVQAEPKPKQTRKPRSRKKPAAKERAAPGRKAESEPKAPIAEPVSAPPPPTPRIRVRRRPKDPLGLGPGERWKRRLPPHAR